MGVEELATLSELNEFNTTLALLAANLNYHANDSLSTAHGGIDLLKGYVDGSGNDLRTYQDSAGHIYSNTDTSKYNFVRFVVAGQPYYAPAQETALAGQDSSTGAIGDTTAISDVPAGTTLITDFISLESQAAININSLLLEHTKKSFGEAHLSVTALASPVLDSNGDTVGRQRIRMQIANLVYEIPVDTRLGGPWQPPRILYTRWNDNGQSWSVNIPAGSGWPATLYGNVSATGSAPFTYRWQYREDGGSNDYVDLADSGTVQNPYGFGINFSGGNTNQLVITDQNIPNNSTKHGYLRCKVTNTENAVTYTTYSDVLTLSITDHTGGSWLCTVAYDKGDIPKRIYMADLIYTRRHCSQVVRDGYAVWAFPLSVQLYKREWLYRLWLPAIKAWTYHMAFLHGEYPRDNVAGTILFGVIKPICGLIGYCSYGVKWLKRQLSFAASQ